MMPTFKDIPQKAEDMKTDELLQTNIEEFNLGGHLWGNDWWKRMDCDDEDLMFQLGMRLKNHKSDCDPLFAV